MQVYIGIDWSESKHDVVFMNAEGAVVARGVIEHTPAGFMRLEGMRQRLGEKAEECAVGLETAHNIVIDFLWSCG